MIFTCSILIVFNTLECVMTSWYSDAPPHLNLMHYHQFYGMISCQSISFVFNASNSIMTRWYSDILSPLDSLHYNAFSFNDILIINVPCIKHLIRYFIEGYSHLQYQLYLMRSNALCRDHVRIFILVWISSIRIRIHFW